MKTKLFIYSSLLITLISCSLIANHYHDGQYQGDIFFFDVTWSINGNVITVNNNLTGISKVDCKQFPNYIEYKEKDGSKKIIEVLQNGNLRINNSIILTKIQ
ncbi:hypothetical protein [Chishuiella sp.]|uniref:hypothetical protein n=1 Tax=Chishuiella sp. TaxID=1969467 RepID=UPI0028A8B39A|nr:hypothetical protein [Chishuiella sp.]